MTDTRSKTLRAVGCGLAALIACAPTCRPAAADDGRRLDERYAVAGVHTVRLDVPVGDLRLEGTGEDEVAVSAEIGCTGGGRRCREAMQGIRLGGKSSGGELRIALDGWPDGGSTKGLALEMRVMMPRTLAIAAQLGVGELHASGLDADLDLDVGVGEVEVRRAEAGVKRVKLDVGVGEATLVVGRRSIEGSGFLGRSIDWKGEGEAAKVQVDCGVGQVTVRLE